MFLFLDLNLHGLLFSFVISLTNNERLRNGYPNIWSLAQRRWGNAIAERTDQAGCILKYSGYHGSVNELKDNLQIEMLCCVTLLRWNMVKTGGVSRQNMVIIIVTTAADSLRILNGSLC